MTIESSYNAQITPGACAEIAYHFMTLAHSPKPRPAHRNPSNLTDSDRSYNQELGVCPFLLVFIDSSFLSSGKDDDGLNISVIIESCYQFTSLSWSLRDRNAPLVPVGFSRRWFAGILFSKSAVLLLAL